MRILTAEEMREVDRATIEGGYASGADLMESAGMGVVEAMERHDGSLLGLRVLVLCGTGNNGGDGFVAARGLRGRGAEVHVGLAGDPEKVRGDARIHMDWLVSEGVAVEPAAADADLARLVRARDQWDFALDALLGTGARGEPEGPIASAVDALRALDEAGTRIVAVDLPTGVNADTGEIARRAVRADLTVTFGAPKRGHVLWPGRAFVGALEVVDIGLHMPDDLSRPGVWLATADELCEQVPRRDPRAHKGSVGEVLLVGGAAGLTGAVTLAARAATRAGAGYVRVAVPEGLSDILEVKLTEQIKLAMPQTARRTLSLAALEPILEAAARADVIAIGPGLSRDPEAVELARALVARSPLPIVLDADGLSAFEGRAVELTRGAGPRILTPHIGEMSRLTGLGHETIEADRIDAPREWAKAWDSVVVLKGAPSVTASPSGHACVNPSGNPGMATLGMGDVLTGLVAALVAQGLAPYDAARLGVFVHGRAGDLVAERNGELGLTAGDVVEALPLALVELTRRRGEALERRGRARPRDP